MIKLLVLHLNSQTLEQVFSLRMIKFADVIKLRILTSYNHTYYLGFVQN